MFTVKPPTRCYVTALKDKAMQFEAIQTLGDLKDAISSKVPVVYGFTVYESFESQSVARMGVLPMPKPGKATVGGDAVLAVSYSDTEGHLVVRSRGKTRGVSTATSTCLISS